MNNSGLQSFINFFRRSMVGNINFLRKNAAKNFSKCLKQILNCCGTKYFKYRVIKLSNNLSVTNVLQLKLNLKKNLRKALDQGVVVAVFIKLRHGLPHADKCRASISVYGAVEKHARKDKKKLF